MFKTVEDFRAHVPAFAIIEMTRDMVLDHMGTKYQTYKGSELLCINTLAKDAVERGVAKPARRLFKDHYRPYNGQDLNGKTLMLWRSGGIGDILWLRPIMIHLKRKYDCTIMFATRDMFHDFVKLWPDAIDQLSGVPMEMWQTFDRADYHLSFEGLIEKCKEAETLDAHDLFAKYAGLDPDEIDWCVPIKMPKTRKRHFSKPKDHSTWYKMNPGRYVVIQYRASAAVRTPYTGSIVAAVNAATECGYHVVISDRRESARAIDDIISCCKHPKKIENFAYKTEGLVQALTLVTHAKLVIAPDSSQMHMAAMQGVPSIGLYGPFPGAVRCSRYPHAKWIEPEPSDVCEFGGRACFRHQYLECPGSYKCWGHLDNDKLQEMIRECLRS
jgi:ADP-heptose:LPS heptosyltransferase